MRIALAPHMSGGYAAMHEIDIDGTERKIFCGFVDEIGMGGKSTKLKKVGCSTVYRADGSDEYEE